MFTFWVLGTVHKVQSKSGKKSITLLCRRERRDVGNKMNLFKSKDSMASHANNTTGSCNSNNSPPCNTNKSPSSLTLGNTGKRGTRTHNVVTTTPPISELDTSNHFSIFIFIYVYRRHPLVFTSYWLPIFLINQIHIGSCFFIHNSHIGAGGLKSLLNSSTPLYLSKTPFVFHQLLITNQ